MTSQNEDDPFHMFQRHELAFDHAILASRLSRLIPPEPAVANLSSAQRGSC
jgi:hypothetical protein